MLDIELNNVTVNFKGTSALEDVTCSLEAGKIYGLIGRNGAGKTTLLSLLASYREPTSGVVKIGGEIPFENGKIMSQVNFIYDVDYSDGVFI